MTGKAPASPEMGGNRIFVLDLICVKAINKQWLYVLRQQKRPDRKAEPAGAGHDNHLLDRHPPCDHTGRTGRRSFWPRRTTRHPPRRLSCRTNAKRRSGRRRAGAHLGGSRLQNRPGRAGRWRLAGTLSGQPAAAAGASRADRPAGTPNLAVAVSPWHAHRACDAGAALSHAGPGRADRTGTRRAALGRTDVAAGRSRPRAVLGRSAAGRRGCPVGDPGGDAANAATHCRLSRLSRRRRARPAPDAPDQARPSPVNLPGTAPASGRGRRTPVFAAARNGPPPRGRRRR